MTKKGKLLAIPTEAGVTMGIGRGAGETMRIIDIDGRPGLYFCGYKMVRKEETR